LDGVEAHFLWGGACAMHTNKCDKFNSRNQEKENQYPKVLF
jgi:hypothetical protein